MQSFKDHPLGESYAVLRKQLASLLDDVEGQLQAAHEWALNTHNKRLGMQVDENPTAVSEREPSLEGFSSFVQVTHHLSTNPHSLTPLKFANTAMSMFSTTIPDALHPHDLPLLAPEVVEMVTANGPTLAGAEFRCMWAVAGVNWDGCLLGRP